ncbi:MAG: hypothetical protein FWF67_06835 [Fibromonadales bacterium]|nr:hypothetical protein [Fibromonadales bacterium]
MDSKVENPQTRVTAYRIFMSKQGSEKWEELETPSELSPFNMYGDASGLYVGFHRNGQLWHYKPDSKKWTNLFKMELTAKQSYTVYGIAEFEGRIVASIAGYNNIENTDTYDATGLILHMQPDGTLKNIAPPDELEIWFRNYNRVPLHFTDAAEWRGKLFVSSAECGIWVYDNASWQKLPEYEEKDSPYVIELHKDRLYVGQYAYGGVQEIQNVIPEFRWIAILQLMAVIEKGHRYMSRH